MLDLNDFLPLYYPSCDTPTRLDRVDNPLAGKFKAKQADVCAICGIMWRLQFESPDRLLSFASHQFFIR